jgi:predicted enzyme related to lactoylglutathione lyase
MQVMFKKLRTIIYHVDNLPKAKEWYTKITGVSPYFDEGFYTGFTISGCELGLDPDLTGISAGEHSVAYWSVDDIEEAVKTLTTHGAGIINPISEVGEGIRVAVVKDPFGNSIGLIEERS